MTSMNKRWRLLAPRPYSSLWIWCATHREQPQQPYDYYLPQSIVDCLDGGKDSDSEDAFGSEDGFSSSPINFEDGKDDDYSMDWLDSKLASLDQSIPDATQCVIKSIPVAPSESYSLRQSSRVNNFDQSGQQSKSSFKKEKDPRRKRTDPVDGYRVNDRQSPLAESPVKRKQQGNQSKPSREPGAPPIESTMKVLDVKEGKTVVVLKKSSLNYFSFIYGDAKITPIVGSIVCDGYLLKTNASTYISTGFGLYQICVGLLAYQRYPTTDHLSEILDQHEIPHSLQEEISSYLTNRDSSLSESIIMLVEKWNWPALAILRLLVKPEVTFHHWFHISFKPSKSPVSQWANLIDRLCSDLKNKTQTAKDKKCDVDLLKAGNATAGVRVVLLGGTNSGKSSLTRHLCNQMTSYFGDKVFVIDCDPGQSEFSAPGLVTAVCVKEPILSPPFVNCLRYHENVIASCSVAGVGTQNNPDLYVLGVYHVWKTFLSSLSPEDLTKPVLINTIGWTQGLGIHLMVDVLRNFQPTHVIEIKRPPWDGKDNFPFDCRPTIVNTLDGWLLRPQPDPATPSSLASSVCALKPYLNYDYIRVSNQFAPKKCSQSARANRVHNQLGYFCLTKDLLFKSIFELEPISLDLEKLYFHVQYEFPVDKNLVPHVIQGSWVHLCSVTESSLHAINESPNHPENNRPTSSGSIIDNRLASGSLPVQPSEATSSSLNKTEALGTMTPGNNSDTSPVGEPKQSGLFSVPPGVALDPSVSVFRSELRFDFKILPFLKENICHGSGIVRKIDLENKKIFLLTPEPMEKISLVNCIVRPQNIVVPESLQSTKNPSN